MCIVNWLGDDLLSEIYLKQQKNSQQNPPSHESASCGQECSDHQRWGFPDGSHIGERLWTFPAQSRSCLTLIQWHQSEIIEAKNSICPRNCWSFCMESDLYKGARGMRTLMNGFIYIYIYTLTFWTLEISRVRMQTPGLPVTWGKIPGFSNKSWVCRKKPGFSYFAETFNSSWDGAADVWQYIWSS